MKLSILLNRLEIHNVVYLLIVLREGVARAGKVLSRRWPAQIGPFEGTANRRCRYLWVAWWTW